MRILSLIQRFCDKPKEINDVGRYHGTQYARADLALPSDLTDVEWALLEPFFPLPLHVGRPRKWSLRRIVKAILHLLRGGRSWRMLPPCLPPASTVRRWFYLWRDNRLWLSLNHTLLLIGRETAGRRGSPSAGVIDSQSVKVTESGGSRGYDAGKKSKGRKRHILTDTDSNLLHAVVHAADIQGRDDAPLVLAEIIRRVPWLRYAFVDGGYAGDKLRDALRRNHRLAKEFEQNITSATAWLFITNRGR